MGLLPDRLKFAFRRSPPPSPAAAPTDPPPEFLCPISGELMADPVIISSGETFDRICIESLQNLSFNSSSSSSLLLIPNSALRSAILRWCDNSGVAHPITLSSETAICYARRHLSSSSSSKSVLLSSYTKLQANCSTKLPNESTSSIPYSSSSSSCSTEMITLEAQKANFPKPLANCSTESPNENSSSITYSSSSSSDHSSSSSSSSTEINPLKTQKSVLLSSDIKPLPNCSTELPNESSSSITYSSSSSSAEIISDPLENDILQKLKNGQRQEQENALISLLEATRESASRRISLGSATLLSSLRRLLLSRHPTIQSTALAIIVNLSLEPPNKIPIVRSGSVPSIINLLQSPSKENATNVATKSCDRNLYCYEQVQFFRLAISNCALI